MNDGPTGLADHPRVRRWLEATGHDRADAEVRGRFLQVLWGFLSHAELSPDALVEFCFLRKRETGERFLSTKRRVAVNELIASYVDRQGWSGKEAVVNANVVRSFLIHNGVLIQGGVWTRG
ncbi:hypothetical protein [Mycobacterium vicinigordonae]|uniref:Integrase n=1 Tax=Mycobacterium vicinigordonae TaxID=1719132 RepID=A0A7D6DWI5_9MYCO|nr:hypothetical protein [Mycobacterium vicinigordonae]QLL06507.1 hypothetical protein H0P51_22660 [Mycobacterium vicinigordonae]